MELPFGGRFDRRTGRELNRLIGDFRPAAMLCWMNRASRMTPAAGPVKVGRLGGYYDLKYYRDCDYLIGNTPGIVDYLTAAGWPADCC